MGFWDFLFINEDAEQPTPEETADTPKQNSDAVELYPGLQLDLVLDDGQQLLSGVIVAVDFPNEVVIDRLPGGLSFPISPEDTPVHVHGYTRQTMPFHFKAAIKESSRIICKIKNLELQTYVEGRQTFRLPLHVPVSMFYQHDKYMQNPEKCTLIDLSTGGACIESEYIHAEGEVLRIKAQIEDYAPMTFLGEIIRVDEPSPGVFRYGFLFAKLKEDEITALNRTLYNLQVGRREEWSRRTKNGNWQ